MFAWNLPVGDALILCCLGIPAIIVGIVILIIGWIKLRKPPQPPR